MSASHSIRELSGKSWHEWPHTQLVEDMDALSPSPAASSCSTSITPTSSRSHSPKPLNESDACMRLPRKDTHIYGQCPVHDDFVLVVCDICQASVKIEAFASHVRLRHQKSGSGSGSGRYNTKACSVDLLKEDVFSLSTRPIVTAVAAAATPTATPMVVAATPPVNLVEPVKIVPLQLPISKIEPMEVVEETVCSSSKELQIVPTLTSIKDEPIFEDTVVHQIADLGGAGSRSGRPVATPTPPSSVTIAEENNVISIPDTDPLPHGMSNDLMAIMGEAPLVETPPPSSRSITPTVTPTMTSTTAQVGANPNSMPLIRLQVKPEPGGMPTEAVIQQPKKVGSSPMKISTPPTPGGSGGMCSSGSGGRMDRKPLREYNADKHCGVWDAETKRHCTRALTCKSHSVLLKRKIEGRSRPFDELVAAHKKAQAEAAAKANCGNMPQQATPTISSIQVRPFTPTVSVTAPPSVASIRTPLLTQVVTGSGVPTCTVATPTKDPNEESLYYTTDHPRPLAVCGFKGGRRVGGLIVTGGRNHIFTRKLVRVAITAGTAASFGGAGFHRIRPRVFIGGGGAPTVTAIETPIQQHQSSYVLNYNLSGNIKRPGGGGGGLNLTPLPPGGVVIPESFKTDIQDFKGGIKFELGRKIKHILPSGSEVTK